MDYSQHGEQKIIIENLPRTGTLLSIGENDGKTFSNCYQLILNGWKAHLVEPNEKALIDLYICHSNNANVNIYPIALSDTDGMIDLFVSDAHLGIDTGLLSTCNENEIKRWEGTQKFTKTIVESKKVYTFLNQNNISKIDFISIDAEGLDYYLLTQFDFNKLKTNLVCVEYNGKEKYKYIHHMNLYNFNLIYENGCNLIFKK